MTTLSDRIKYFRLKARLNQETASQKLNMTSGHLGRIERGERKPTAERLEQFAKLYKCNVSDFYQDVEEEQEGIPVIGFLNEQSRIEAAKDSKKEVTDTQGLIGVELVALKVKQPVYPHFFKDDVIIYDQGKPFRSKLYMNKQCVVEISRSTTVLGVLSRGRKPNTYTIMPYNGSPIEDTKILSAYPVILIKHKQI